MTHNLKVGDRVQWWEVFKNTKHEPRMMTGTIISTGMYIGIWGDIPPGATAKEKRLFGGTWVRPASVLTRIEDPGGEQKAAMP